MPRIEKALPKFTKSRTLIWEPSRNCENKLKLLPKRLMERTLRLDPRFMKSRIERELPSATRLKTEDADPILK
jgi:hypothetical protein